jgi:replicative DNA helicase
MSDLRGHGANEQVADFIGILYRDYDREKQADQDYDENADVWLNTLEICKQRNGPTGPVWFRFDRPTMRYEDETMNTGNKADGDRRRAETTAGGEL